MNMATTIDIWTFPASLSEHASKEVISKYIPVPAENIELSSGLFIKPEVLNTGFRGTIHFNMSHSADEGILAVSDEPLGIDIERIRPLYSPEDAFGLSCTEEELRILDSVGKDVRERLFFEIWTRKEACVKALGMDILTAAGQFQCIAETPAGPAAWEYLDMFWQDGNPWYLKTPVQKDGFVSCCCTPKQDAEFEYHSWKEGDHHSGRS